MPRLAQQGDRMRTLNPGMASDRSLIERRGIVVATTKAGDCCGKEIVFKAHSRLAKLPFLDSALRHSISAVLGRGGCRGWYTLHPQPSTLNPTLNPQPSTLNPQTSTFNPQPQPLITEPYILNLNS